MSWVLGRSGLLVKVGMAFRKDLTDISGGCLVLFFNTHFAVPWALQQANKLLAGVRNT